MEIMDGVGVEDVNYGASVLFKVFNNRNYITNLSIFTGKFC